MKLEVVVTDVSQCQKELAIEVPSEEVKAEFEKTYDTYARHVKVPGFRPGRVPRAVVKQRFSKEIKDEVLQQLLPHALQHAVVDHKLRFVGEPTIEDVSISENEPLKFKALLEVLPEFDLKEYKGLKAVKRVTRITDEDVERVIEGWRENAAELVPAEDRTSQEGDVVSVNLTGKYVDPQEEHEQEDLKADDVKIEIGGNGGLAEFNENLSGVKADDVREFRVVYPEDFESKGLAGKSVDFTVTVLDVRKKTLPELNDDFARDFGDHQNIGELRDKIREELTTNAERQAESKLRDELLEQILSSYDFEVPSLLIEQQARELANQFAYTLIRSGMPPDSLKQLNWEEQINRMHPQAVREVRAAMIVAKIGEAEKVQISEEEIEAEMNRMVTSTGETVEQLKARLTRDEAISSIENSLRYRKSLDAVVSNADVTVEEITEAQAQEQQKSQQAPPEVQAAAE